MLDVSVIVDTWMMWPESLIESRPTTKECSRETIEKYVSESIDHLAASSKVTRFFGVLGERFARERLDALAHVEGRVAKERPEVLFVCVHNAGRSQMAAGLLDWRSGGRVHVRSAGSAPTDTIRSMSAFRRCSKNRASPFRTDLVAAPLTRVLVDPVSRGCRSQGCRNLRQPSLSIPDRGPAPGCMSLDETRPQKWRSPNVAMS